MMQIIDNLRLALAECMLGWILGIAPKYHPDSDRIIAHIHKYRQQKVIDHAKEDLEHRLKWDPEGTCAWMEERKKNEHK